MMMVTQDFNQAIARAQLTYLSKDWPAAEAQFRALLDQGRELPLLWVRIGNCRERLGDLDGALDAYARAREHYRPPPVYADYYHTPDQRAPWERPAILLESKLKRPGEALAILADAIERRVEFPGLAKRWERVQDKLGLDPAPLPEHPDTTTRELRQRIEDTYNVHFARRGRVMCLGCRRDTRACTCGDEDRLRAVSLGQAAVGMMGFMAAWRARRLGRQEVLVAFDLQRRGARGGWGRLI